MAHWFGAQYMLSSPQTPTYFFPQLRASRWVGVFLYPRVSIQDQDLGAFLKDSGDQDDDGRNSQAIQAIQDNLSLESICSDLQEYVLHKN